MRILAHASLGIRDAGVRQRCHGSPIRFVGASFPSRHERFTQEVANPSDRVNMRARILEHDRHLVASNPLQLGRRQV